VADKLDYNRHSRQFDEEGESQHFKSWETFWGRPGYGAPREVVQKGNLMKMLHYPEKVSPGIRVSVLSRRRPTWSSSRWSAFPPSDRSRSCPRTGARQSICMFLVHSSRTEPGHLHCTVLFLLLHFGNTCTGGCPPKKYAWQKGLERHCY
jgi:hypothetical protein